jgi:fructokinase
MIMNKIGVDIGKTKIECCVLSTTNEVLFRERLPTGSVYEEIEVLYNKAILYTNTTEHTLGVCMPGSISNRTGLMINSSIGFLNDTDFVGMLETRLNRKIQIANDSQCFALAESLLGVGNGYNTVFGMILGTGVGGGIVINGMLHKGFHNISCEWGHTTLDPSNNIMCRCGRIGCVETWLSGSGIDTWAYNLTNKKLSTKEYMEMTEIQECFLNKFGLAVSNLVQVLDPDCIVIGGGISNNDILFTQGIESVKKNIFNDEFNTPIYRAKLGDSAGVIGAALLWQTM